MRVIDIIKAKLEQGLSPVQLDIIDESYKHKGHSGARPEGETHFHLHIIADAFKGLSRIEQQRKVHTLLKEELKGRVHALSMKTGVPTE